LDKITGVLDALQNIFGKGFLLAGFLPVVTLLSVSWILGCWLSPECRDLSEYFLRAKLLQQFAIGVLLILLLAMASFVFWLLNPAFRQILEGRILLIEDWLAEGHRKTFRNLTTRLQDLLTELGRYREARDPAHWPATLLAASTGSGHALHNTSLPREFESLSTALVHLDPVDFARVDTLCNDLRTELARTSITHVPELGRMRDDFVNVLLDLGEQSAGRAYFRQLHDRTYRYPERIMNIGPTALANFQEAQRDYLSRSYGIDIGLFWADIQSVAAVDEKFASVIENAKTRYDFSVAMTAMSALFTILWIALHIALGAGLFGPDLAVFLAVAVVGFATTFIFHRLVLISYRAFGDTIRSAVELYRFKLMKQLHLKLPASDTEEQIIWRGLAQSLETGVTAPISYEHPA
jgi:hypothetical protein